MEYRLSVYHNYKSCSDMVGYSELQNEKDIDERKLEDIVNFTTSYSNEQELRMSLSNGHIASRDNLYGNFAINFYRSKNSDPKLFSFAIPFKDEAKYFDILYLRAYYLSKQTDVTFMDKFLNKYYSYLKNIARYRCLHTVKNANEALKKGKSLSVYAHNSFSDFIEIYCFKKNSKGDYVPAFKNIFELAMYAILYERTLVDDFNRMDTIDDEIAHYKDLIERNAVPYEAIQSLEDKLDELEGIKRTLSKRL